METPLIPPPITREEVVRELQGLSMSREGRRREILVRAVELLGKPATLENAEWLDTSQQWVDDRIGYGRGVLRHNYRHALTLPTGQEIAFVVQTELGDAWHADILDGIGPGDSAAGNAIGYRPNTSLGSFGDLEVAKVRVEDYFRDHPVPPRQSPIYEAHGEPTNNGEVDDSWKRELHENE